MIAILDGVHRERRLRRFAERSSADMTGAGTRDEFRSLLYRKAEQLKEEGLTVDLDPRFPFRASPADCDDGRIELILRRFNGLEHLDDLRFDRGIERRLMASYLREGARFGNKRFPPRVPVSIRLIDTAIGFGVFAERDVAEGEHLGEYAGIVRVSEEIVERTYCYEYPSLSIGEDEIRLALDAHDAGNEMRFINHAKLETVSHNFEFYGGHWHTVFTVNAPIAAGEQILIDYGESYWEGRSIVPGTLTP